MNKLILAFLLGISFTSLFAFRSSLFVPKKSTAEVEKIEEFYVFTDSKPVMPFDSLGIVDAGFITGTEYESIRASLLRRARKKFPEGDGVILLLNQRGLDKCCVIKFKP